jgi:hypothetical protein
MFFPLFSFAVVVFGSGGRIIHGTLTEDRVEVAVKGSRNKTYVR